MSERVSVPGTVGGMQVLCELPDGYGGPDRAPLMIDRETGAVACIVAPPCELDGCACWRR